MLIIRCKYFRLYSLLVTWLNCGYSYNSEINPFRVLWVPPENIVKKSERLIRKKKRLFSHVLDGDWDQSTQSFTEHPIYMFLKARFHEGYKWHQLPYYKWALENIQKRGCFWNGCRSESDLIQRCQMLDKLYHDILIYGYTVPAGLNFNKPGIAQGPKPVEIKVRIGRDGSFIHENGRHRLAIAFLLGLEVIPVQPIIRHKEWQRLRDQVITGRTEAERRKIAGKYQDHPDISYLLTWKLILPKGTLANTEDKVPR